ncbi:MAG: penicillin acylase family protein, partial [Sphaerospermopsis sp. SIO1G2]|nr:penicillin acylase family protein [Sphaerospermopsis sp. SIO1G2]
IPFDEMPLLFNPPSGYIVTSNNAVVDEEYPYFLAYAWANGDRSSRIEQMIHNEILSSETGISTADIGRMQNDSYSLVAEDWVPHLLALPAQPNAEVQAALDTLQDWDYQLRRDSIAASVFEIFYWHLIQETFGDELGEEASELYMGHSLTIRVLLNKLATNEHDLWWDDVATQNTIEKRDDIVLRSLQKTVTWLMNNHGRRPAAWTWGNVHQATFRSNPLGQSGIGFLESQVNIGPFPVDGGEGTVNAVGWDWDEPAAVNWHPSMRMIVDMGDFDRSLAVIPTGQSGHPGHPHYDDLAPMWLEGEFHPQWYSRTAVDNNTAEMLILLPEE